MVCLRNTCINTLHKGDNDDDDDDYDDDNNNNNNTVKKDHLQSATLTGDEGSQENRRNIVEV